MPVDATRLVRRGVGVPSPSDLVWESITALGFIAKVIAIISLF
jgi:hypothetical protein